MLVVIVVVVSNLEPGGTEREIKKLKLPKIAPSGVVARIETK